MEAVCASETSDNSSYRIIYSKVHKKIFFT